MTGVVLLGDLRKMNIIKVVQSHWNLIRIEIYLGLDSSHFLAPLSIEILKRQLKISDSKGQKGNINIQVDIPIDFNKIIGLVISVCYL